MNYKKAENDSGNYVNGIYTTKNGFSGSGLNCPRGVRLYNTEIKQAGFFEPDDTQVGEHFERISKDVAPDILPYYAISNLGRVYNTYSGKYIKPNYRPNGYEYLCLSAENCNYGQKKYSTHRMVMKTFYPIENMDNLEVNHINGDKTDNYVDKVFDNGDIKSNLEWSTAKENSMHRDNMYNGSNRIRLSEDDVQHIRSLHDQGYSYNQIKTNFYNNISCTTIQNICKNRSHHDPNYIPKTYEDSYKFNPANLNRLTDSDAELIRELAAHSFKYEEIKEKFFPNISVAAISDVVRYKTHNRNNQN